ncbi:hypothetical protein TorRG33x02_111160 [Trema orientale]|uniref:Uncharacterized protein n=1 Tax=Trema orientale TaxID=63057 RepID=A0A2P5F5Y8_TREOI|nr:hypothetical protein TorRG33x02_111160 [Trema orientale]
MSKAIEKLRMESARSSWVMSELEKRVSAKLEGKWVLVRRDGFVAERERGRKWASSFWACRG